MSENATPNKKNKQQQDDRQKFRAFAILANHLSEDFKNLAVDLLWLVREYGIRNFSASGKETPTKETFPKFAALVHEGWKQAQLKIAARLILNLENQQKGEIELKEYRRLKDAARIETQKREIYRINLEILVLRRIFDVIPWTIFQNEHSTIRRLQIKGGESNLSIKNINETMPAASLYNEDPQQVAICTDITTFIHIGDLFLCDMNTGKRAFVELKSGEKNIEMSRAAAFAVDSGCLKFDESIRSPLTQKDQEHYDRTKRQYLRNTNVARTINEEIGEDNNTGATVHIKSTETAPAYYAELIKICCDELSESKHWSIATVEQCVHIGVYSDPKMALLGFSVWMSEMKCDSKIYNLTDSFGMPMVRPFGSLDLPYELLVKILRGEIQIFLCLDIRELMNLGNRLFPGFLSLANKRETGESRARHFEMVELDERVIKTHGRHMNGQLGIGIISRVVFDFQFPSNALKLLHSAIYLSKDESDVDMNDEK